MEEYNLLSNSDLETKCKELEEEFKERQKIVSENWDAMFTLSQEYNKIKEIINKRTGNNGLQQ